MLIMLTIAVMGGAMLIMSIALLLTGENKVHSSCSATSHLDGEDASCSFCPNDDEEDQITTLSKAGYPGRKDLLSKEVYIGKQDRNLAVERLKYNTGRD